jgi:ADP-ribosylglycohydrolase
LSLQIFSPLLCRYPLNVALLLRLASTPCTVKKYLAALNALLFYISIKYPPINDCKMHRIHEREAETLRKLTDEQTIERIYAGWLGKLIGVRLGAPVEMWSSEQIEQKYGEKAGYLADYKEFAADDDINGPAFFVRAAEDCAGREPLARDVGDAWLNYASWGKGMFWWGGYGVSAEHTAYDNLRAGIKAPHSGSMKLNGALLSQQIGGQIFSDCWGLIAPGNPDKAARLAENAASVSHDGEAMQGGRFVAACVSAAFTAESVNEIIEAGLARLSPGSVYADMVRDMRAYCLRHPGDWKTCLEYIKCKYWRDRFGGNCHIIPNAAIMILALTHGGGDFTCTLTICNRCGFDTDCNAGNLGAIMGVFAGLDGMDQTLWRDPINDFFACSSVMGALNLNDAARFSLYLARLSARMGSGIPEDLLADMPRVNFRLPGSTHACLLETGGKIATALNCRKPDGPGGMLKLTLEPGVSRVYQRTYMRPDEFFDDRYTPSLSPLIYPGQWMTAKIAGDTGMSARLFARDINSGNDIFGEWQYLPDKNTVHLRWQIPYLSGACLCRAGVEWETNAGGTAFLHALDYGGAADYTVDFTKERMEEWTRLHQEVSQFTAMKGYWQLEQGQMRGSCADIGEAYTGDPEWRDMAVSCTVMPVYGGKHRLLARVQGAMRAYAAELSGSGLTLLKNDYGWRGLVTVPYAWTPDTRVTLKMECRQNRLSVYADGKLMICFADEDKSWLRGAAGLGVADGACCLFSDFSIRPLPEE